MEIWDIYNEKREKTGRTIIRDSEEKLQDGEYHLIAQAIIINSRNQIFLGQRAEFKKIAPLKWETIGGSVIRGEDTLDGIIRELKEEIGITVERADAILLKKLKSDTEKVFKDIWLFKKDIKIEQLTFTDNEVINAKWVNKDEFEKMLKNGEITINVDLDINDIEQALKLI